MKLENFRLIYLQDNFKNEDTINKALLWPNDLAQLINNFILLNIDKKLLDMLKMHNVYKFNLSS